MGEEIRKAREAKGLTQKEVAEIIGVDVTEVDSWEKSNIPKASIREFLSGLFETKIDIDRQPLETEIHNTIPQMRTGQLENILSYLRVVARDTHYGVILSLTQCPSCGFVTADDLSCPSTPCPNCKKTDETRCMWPGLELLDLIDSVYLFSQQKDEKLQKISIIVFCQIFEGLLEEFLEGFMEKRGNSPEVIHLILNRYKNVEERAGTVYKDLTGNGFKEDLESMKFNGWHKDWMEIKDTRNRLLHVKQIFVKEDVLEKTKRRSENITGIFAGLNNKYCVGKR